MAQDLERERELQALADEMAILRHAERIKVISCRERAIKALTDALWEINHVELLSERGVRHS